MATIYSKINEVLKSYGLDNEHAVQEILEVMQKPHDYSVTDIEKMVENDQSDLPAKFNVLDYDIKTVLQAANYGLKYALESQHSGFVPAGNVLQMLSNNMMIEGHTKPVLKLYKEDAETMKQAFELLDDNVDVESKIGDEENQKVESLSRYVSSWLEL